MVKALTLRTDSHTNVRIDEGHRDWLLSGSALGEQSVSKSASCISVDEGQMSRDSDGET